MRYELTDFEWAAIGPMLPNKPRVDDRRVLNGIFWVLRAGGSSRTPGEAHDNRLCSVLLSALVPQTMLLADRGYDADWIRELVRRQGARAIHRSEIAKTLSALAPICIVRVT
jgi:transposase